MSLVDWFLSAIKPRKKLSYREFLNREFFLADGEHKGELFQPSQWQDAIIDRIPKYRRVILQAVPQSGKTTLLTGYLLWRIQEYADDCLLFSVNQIITHRYFKDKLERATLLNPALKELLPSGYSPKQTPTSEINFNNAASIKMDFNAQNIRSYTAKIICSTEAAKFAKVTASEADVITLAEQRAASYSNGVCFFESTPTLDTTKFNELLLSGTMTRLQVICRSCRKQFDPGARENLYGWQDAKSLEEVAGKIICPHCKEEFKGGKLVVVDANPNATTLSVIVNWYWTLRTAQEVAEAEYLYKQNPDADGWRNLQQNYYCNAVNEEEEARELNKVLTTARFTEEHILQRRGSFARREVPPDVDVITVGMDCQKSWGYFIVYGFSSTSGNSYILDFNPFLVVPFELQEKVSPTAEMVLSALESVYNDLTNLYHPKSFMIDVGYKHVSSDRHIIQEWAASKTNVKPIKGRSKTEIQKLKNGLVVPPSLKDFMAAYAEKNGQVLFFLNVDELKEELNRLIRLPLNVPSIYFTQEILKPNGARTHLFHHFMAETRKEMEDRLGNRFVHWENRGGRNDIWDATVYAFAASLLERERLPKVKTVAVNPPQKKTAGRRFVMKKNSLGGF